MIWVRLKVEFLMFHRPYTFYTFFLILFSKMFLISLEVEADFVKFGTCFLIAMQVIRLSDKCFSTKAVWAHMCMTQ